MIPKMNKFLVACQLIFGIVFVLISCENPNINEEPNTMPQPEGMDKIHYVSRYLYAINQIHEISEYLYNENERLSIINNLNSDSSLASYTLYYYDQKGLCDKTSKFEADSDVLLETSEFEYDEAGNIIRNEIEYEIEDTGDYQLIYIYEYDENNFLIKFIHYSIQPLDYREGYTLYTNDSYGNVISEKHFDSEGNITGNTQHRYENNYLVESIRYSGNDQENRSSKIIRDYDQRSNLVLKQIRYLNSVHSSYYYNYDLIYEYY